MDRVCLIIVPSVFLASEKVFVSLGPLKVASSLENRDVPVSMLDLNGISNYCNVVEKFCKETDARIFGLSITTPQLPCALKIVNTIRNILPEAKCVAGGPHITSTCAAYKREVRLGIVSRAHRAFKQIAEAFDVFCSGDGEESIMLAIQPGRKGLIDADDPDSNLFLKPYQLNSYPFPNRKLVDLQSYKYFIDGTPATSYISQLGCPFPCTFCNGRLSPSFRRVRTRSPENLKEEIRQIYQEFGYTAFMDYSDEANLYPNVIESLQYLISLQDEIGESFKLRGFIKSNLFTREQAKAFKEAGFVELCVGAESGSDRILRNIQKKSTRDQNTRCVDLCHEFGIRCKAFCSIGHAGESENSIAETKDWLISAAPDDFDATCVVCYGGTPYYDFAVEIPDRPGIWVYTAKETGDNLYSYEVDFGSNFSYYKGIPGNYKSLVFTDYLSSERLVELRDDLEREVRSALKLPYYQVTPASRFEHSMGVIDSSLVHHSQTESPMTSPPPRGEDF